MVEVMPTIDDGKDPKNPKKKKDVYVKEEAPKGKKYERMIKHIKRSYAKDGGLTKDEKSIAYATAWKHKNKVTKEETCGKGEYFCNDRKKCMPIPKGMKVRDDGFLTKESFESGVLKARRHHRKGKLMSFKDFVKIMGDILGEWES